MSYFKKLKCTKFAPDPARGAYSAPPDDLAGFKGAYTSKGREERKNGRKGKGGKKGGDLL